MPKAKTSMSNKLAQYVREYSSFKTDGAVLFCKVCNKSVSTEKTFTVKQHLASKKHIELAMRNETNNTQRFFGESSKMKEKNVQFAEDLCRALISADIPLYKMRNQNFKSFLEKYTQYKMPSETTLRTNSVKDLYKETIDNIKSCVKNHFLWMSIDETTDATGRYVANVIIGILDFEELISKQKYLLNTAVLDKANHSTIARLFDDSIKILGENFDKDSILLFITDAAPYMVKAAKAIQTFYPKITHLTCLAHGLHRVCEQIRDLYTNVDRLISNVKKVFLKAPSRIQIFKNLEPDLALPPQPITTRWGTWLNAVNYYAINFEKIVQVFDALDDEEAASIKTSKSLLRDSTIKTDLIFIASNYGFLEASIKKLETSGLSLTVQIEIVTRATEAINIVNGEAANIIKKKVANIIMKNSGFAVLKAISACLTEKSSDTENIGNYSIKEILAFKFAPITSVDVERSFSMYKNLLRSNRQNFLFENLSEMFIIYCNQNIN